VLWNFDSTCKQAGSQQSLKMALLVIIAVFLSLGLWLIGRLFSGYSQVGPDLLRNKKRFKSEDQTRWI